MPTVSLQKANTEMARSKVGYSQQRYYIIYTGQWKEICAGEVGGGEYRDSVRHGGVYCLM